MATNPDDEARLQAIIASIRSQLGIKTADQIDDSWTSISPEWLAPPTTKEQDDDERHDST
jgi:hypothetical protein